jgi:hypothetical protein
MPTVDIDLTELISMQEQLSAPLNHYVYFNPDSGELRHISNELIVDDPYYLKVTFAEISELSFNKDTPANYRVVIDFKTNEYILQNISDGDIRSFNWEDEVYQMPTDTKGSIVLTQDKKQSTWTLQITEQVTKSLTGQAHHANYNLAFYVTKPDDVNVLYHILKFRVIDVTTTGSFTILHQSAAEICSVYCRKVFDSYQHVND